MVKRELFVGNLDRDVDKNKIEDVFEKYGKLLKCELKNKGSGPAFAFLEFEEERDAEDALNAENGKDLSGQAMIVQWARSNDRPRGEYRNNRDGGRGGNFRGGRGGGSGPRSNECFNCHERGHIARDCRKAPSNGGGRRDNGGGRRRDYDGGRSYRDRSRRDRSRSRS